MRQKKIGAAFRAASASLAAFCAVIFAMICYGDFAVPDSFDLSRSDSAVVQLLPELTLPFRADFSAGAQAAAAGRDAAYEVSIRALRVIPVKSARVTVAQRRYVTPGGQAFGIKLYTKGVLVVGIDAVATADGAQNPAAKAGLRKGDIIEKINGAAVLRNAEVSDAVERSAGESVTLEIRRGDKVQLLRFQPVRAVEDGKYRAGIWVRDSSAGIGTVSFWDAQSGVFAGLGHAVCDVDTGEILPISAGEAVKADITGCYPGSGNRPGELCGLFTAEKIGSLERNGDTGIYGYFLGVIPNAAKRLPVAQRCEVQPGAAQIIATVANESPQYYDVEIIKVYAKEDVQRKNMIVKVTDKRLMEKTGGIVQGMSGSPIIQNGMLAGAVTHVFLNNPQQGYGIFAQTMLEQADALSLVA